MLLSAQLVFAVSAEDQSIISQLQKVREQLNTAAGKTAECQTPDMANCSFQDSCQQFAGKGKDFYLYQNAEGRQIHNNQLIANLEAAEACVGKSFPQTPVRDPFIYPQQMAEPANLNRYQQESKRVEQIFGDVQGRMVQLLRSRRTSQNAEAIDNMIARITTAKILTPKNGSKIADLAILGCDIPNAGYNPQTHEVVVCPQLMNLPDSALLSILAHELAHPIDPCQMSMPYSRDGGIISQDEVDVMAPISPPQDAFFKGIKAATNPFKNVISCLQKPESMGVKIPSQNNIVAQLRSEAENAMGLKEEISEANESGDSDVTDTLRAALEERVEGIHRNYEEFKQCFNMTGSGHATEAFADWMSSQVLKQKISEIPDSGKAKTYAAESQMFFMALSCQNLAQSATAAVRPMIQNKCPGLLKQMEAYEAASGQTDTHPDTARRVSRILYAPPEIQKALGCKKDPGLIECK